MMLLVPRNRYAFGILTFEIFSYGDFPFDHMEDHEYSTFLAEGFDCHGDAIGNTRLFGDTVSENTGTGTNSQLPIHSRLIFTERDRIMLDPIAEALLQVCLAWDPEERPTFTQIARRVAVSSQNSHIFHCFVACFLCVF
jgi:hypothetical protein